jgi:23S rRNA pseudouridine1911/1915/1917 synthase
LKQLIEAGAVYSGGAKLSDPDMRVKRGQAVVVEIPPAVRAEPEGQDIALTIVYEDAHLIVIDKQAGLVVHPAAGNRDGTLVNALIAHCGDSLRGIGGELRPGIVHRIDKDTSGLLVVAKTERAQLSLVNQLKDHSVQRTYLAVVRGKPPAEGTVNAPIGRHPTQRTRMAVVHGGKTAVTHYHVIRRYPAHALVECRLETGRTHQIRVHMASAGFPLEGDAVYAGRGPRRFPRQALHAWRLAFTHPGTGKLVSFESPQPEDFHALLAELAVRAPA